jgi:N-acetylneuraminic acid mutarotase
VGLAVNVTELPAQIEPDGTADILTLTANMGLTMTPTVPVPVKDGVTTSVTTTVYIVVTVGLSVGLTTVDVNEEVLEDQE